MENLENSIHGEEIIIERKDFKLLKRIGYSQGAYVFEYFGGITFFLSHKEDNSYQYSIFKALLDGNLERIILLKRKEKYQTKEGFFVTHIIEQEVDTKIRDAYRGT